jgi:hypothetical protein
MNRNRGSAREVEPGAACAASQRRERRALHGRKNVPVDRAQPALRSHT